MPAVGGVDGIGVGGEIVEGGEEGGEAGYLGERELVVEVLWRVEGKVRG